MRLINAKTFQLEEFDGDNVPPYAVLSHTWGRHEVSFADWTMITEDPSSDKAKNLKEKEGYEKVHRFCELVRDIRWCKHKGDGKGRSSCRKNNEVYLCSCCRRSCICEQRLEWAWVDTCCIDKSSSSELSENINSMYKWYRDSYVCYAYLVDVPDTDVLEAPRSAFRESRWFRRGW